MADSGQESRLVFAVIGNIPHIYHSSDLRNYFSQFVESKGFQCFHFRHRPELRKRNSSADTSTSVATTTSYAESGGSKTKLTHKCKQTSCCVVKIRENKLTELIQMYHRKHWLDKTGESMPSLCVIARVKVSSASGDLFNNCNETNQSDESQMVYKTRQEQRVIPPEREEFSTVDLNKLAELHPPDVMPNGNVGTPTLVFLDLIRQCRLPPAVIKKLGLSFPKTRTNKKYGNVPFNYGGVARTGASEDELTVTTGDGFEIIAEGDQRIGQTSKTTPYDIIQSVPETSTDAESNMPVKATNSGVQRCRQLMAERIEETMIEKEQASDSGDDNDTCEEWERHEALYDDPTNQERNKERLFEEEIELKWEKGGSGLVFYTDAQYWDQKDGDFDEKTTDDWDVDMSIYYDNNGGDMDSRDYVAMRQEKRRRDGVEKTDFHTVGIGKFEAHTKGVGRKILSRQGWREGQGLGSTITGRAEALENEGQKPRDRKGFGYRGEKLTRYHGMKRRAQRDVIISTVYDDPADTDPTEHLLRRSQSYTLKYRESVKFKKASESDDT